MSQVIKIENISKQYRLGSIGTNTLRGDLQRWWYTMRGLPDPTLKIGQENLLREASAEKRADSEYVWALRNISLDIDEGEVLGVIGKNGAGKSTLLKLLSRVTAPTTGSIKVKGRIASLLEVGTGFHPDLTGRENIFLNGAILGMKRFEISSKLDEIIDFAGIAKYIDTPVKRYSSGMYVRLAFAVAAHLEPEILIVDEVLAVGDAEFQKKALGKMQEVSGNKGRTVLFVSHNMGAVQKLCKNAILLINGRIENFGIVDSIIAQYESSNSIFSSIIKVPENEDTEKFIGFASQIQIEDQSGKLLDEIPLGTKWQIRIKFIINQRVSYFIIALGFKTMLDSNIRTAFSPRMDLDPGQYEAVFLENEIIFGEGTYKLSLGMSSYEKAIHYVEDFATLKFTPVKNSINDERILRTAAGVILNPMEVVITKTY